MTLRTLGEFLKSPWTYIGLFALAALAGGFVYRRTAQIPDAATREVSLIPTPNIIKYMYVEDADVVLDLGPPTVEIIHEPAGSGISDAHAEYQAAEPGRALYLRGADQVIHLPPDVKVKETIMFGYCADLYSCPIAPAHVLSRGEVTILIDDVGTVFPGNLATDDLKAFPFLACQRIKTPQRSESPALARVKFAFSLALSHRGRGDLLTAIHACFGWDAVSGTFANFSRLNRP